MKTTSWDALGLDRRRTAALVAASALASFVTVVLLVYPFLGQLALVLAAVVGLATSYTVAAAPRRSLELSALAQARESPALAASAAIYLQSTRSRCKTIMMLDSGENRLSSLLDEMKKKTLLGLDLGQGLDASDLLVESGSVRRILRSVVRANAAKLQDEGEELQSIFSSSQSGEETKFPVFMTISFFLPIMLMLFAAMAHHTDPIAISSLALLEIVVLDLALSFSSTERKKLSA